MGPQPSIGRIVFGSKLVPVLADRPNNVVLIQLIAVAKCHLPLAS